MEELSLSSSSIQRLVRTPTIVVYDLGMSDAQITELRSSCGVTVREFQFAKYPAHVRRLSTYAWKPLMIHEALLEWPSIMWLDSSVRMTSPYIFSAYDTAIRTDGLVMFMGTEYSTYSVTHPLMYRYLPSDLQQLKSTVAREAGEEMFYRTRSVHQNIIYWWVLCALDPQCIAPSAAWICIWELLAYIDFLYCHKYDQSALNILIANHYKFNLEQLKPRFKVFTFVRHGPKEGRLRQCRKHD